MALVVAAARWVVPWNRYRRRPEPSRRVESLPLREPQDKPEARRVRVGGPGAALSLACPEPVEGTGQAGRDGSRGREGDGVPFEGLRTGLAAAGAVVAVGVGAVAVVAVGTGVAVAAGAVVAVGSGVDVA